MQYLSSSCLGSCCFFQLPGLFAKDVMDDLISSLSYGHNLGSVIAYPHRQDPYGLPGIGNGFDDDGHDGHDDDEYGHDHMIMIMMMIIAVWSIVSWVWEIVNRICKPYMKP